jgi:uncharacterized protein (TIGR03435 family)
MGCRIGVFVFVLASLAGAQEFEVASIRAAPGDIDRLNVGVRVDGAMVICKSLALRDYIRIAYQVKEYQIAGPEWIGSTRYDINAKIPDGAPRSSLPAMLQALLAERFKMTLHREKREFNAYALVAAKEGVKLTPSPKDGSVESAPPESRGVTVQAGRGGTTVNFGEGSYIRVGEHTIEAKKINLTQLMETLADYLDRPAVDMTGLTGIYDINLEFSLDDLRNLLRSRGIYLTIPDSAGDSMGISIVDSLKKLGLRLEPRKAPLEVLVIDRVEKTPIGN